MTLGRLSLSILGPETSPAVVTATKCLGLQVLARNSCHSIWPSADSGFAGAARDRLDRAEGIAVQVAALAAALGGALLLTWTERVWPEVQEAVIGVTFVLAATGGILLLASNAHGSEHLRDLLVGQILWAQPARLAWAAGVYAVVLALWFGFGERMGRVGFYALFALAVTVSVQLVGLSVFATCRAPIATSGMVAAESRRQGASERWVTPGMALSRPHRRAGAVVVWRSAAWAPRGTSRGPAKYWGQNPNFAFVFTLRLR